MFASKIRAAAVALGVTLTLSACVGPYGDIGVGYGSGGYYGGYGGYSPYGYGSYGYDPYSYGSYGGYNPFGYSPYGGWYDNYYYPGTGYYVYSRDGTRQRWSDSQRRYWESHRNDRRDGDRDHRWRGSTQGQTPVVTTPSTSTNSWRQRDRTRSSTGVTSSAGTTDRGSWTSRRGSMSDGDGRRGRNRERSGD